MRQVWLFHLLTMFLGGATIIIIESSSDAPLPRGGGRGGGAEPLRPTPNGALKSLFAALAHFLWNGQKHAVRTPGGRVALVALSLHTVIMGATYTGSLAGGR